MDLKNRYVIKGINKEQTITSVVTIQTSADGSRIEKVQDKWNGELPDGAIKNVSTSFQVDCVLSSGARPTYTLF
jgi:hypothetical protein